MTVINPAGRMVTIDKATRENLRKQGTWNLFATTPHYTKGEGDPNHWCLLLQDNGIGDCIHALPGIVAKCRDGYTLTIVDRAFRLPYWERVAQVYGIALRTLSCEETTFGWLDTGKKRYGQVVSLPQWCIIHDEETDGKVWMDRFDQLPAMLDTKAPEAFSFAGCLTDEHATSEYILLAAESTSQARSIPSAEARKMLAALDQYGRGVVGLGRGAGMREAATWEELVRLVNRAAVVVAVDNGILAVALAMNKPVVALFGPTDRKTIADQFKRYGYTARHVFADVTEVSHPYAYKNIIQGRCQAPCSLQREMGWDIGGECKKGSLCMKAYTVRRVVEEVGGVLVSGSLSKEITP